MNDTPPQHETLPNRAIVEPASVDEAPPVDRAPSHRPPHDGPPSHRPPSDSPPSDSPPAHRPMGRALLNGALARCPRCGHGPLFNGFLAVRGACPHCGQSLHHHRADDAPPYVVMFIVGHVVVALMLVYEVGWQPPLWQHAAIFLPMTVALSLALLRPVKGALVAFQWASQMHGFHPDGDRYT